MTNKPPRSVSIATQLLLLSVLVFILAVVIGFVTYRITSMPPEMMYQYTGLRILSDSLVYVILLGILIHQMYMGKNWARWIYIIYALARYILHLLTHTVMGVTFIVDILVVIYYAIQISVFVLLFLPSSNAYFHNKQRQ